VQDHPRKPDIGPHVRHDHRRRTAWEDDPEIFGTAEADQALRDEQRLVATGIPMLNVEKNKYHIPTD